MIKSATQSTIANTQKYRNMNGSYVASSDYKLDEVVLTSSVASVTFDVSPYIGLYKNLQLRIVARTDRATLDRDVCGIRFNSDSGNNYSNHRLYGDGNNAALAGYSTSASAIELLGYTTASGATANRYSVYIVDILDSGSSSKNKTVRIFSGGQERGGESGGPGLISGVWLNTSAISSINLISLTSSNWVSGTRFRLYGSN